MPRPGARRSRGDDGAIAVEAAILIPATIVLILVILQLSLYWFGQAVATRAAHEGLEQTRVLNGTPGSGEAVAGQLLSQTSVLGSSSIDATRTDTTATVTVTGEPLTVIPLEFLPGVSLTVTATAAGPVERLEP